MLMKDWKKEIFTIPNLLSIFRLILIPVYVVIYLNAKAPTDYFLAGTILAVSCLTDLIDGKIARHFNMISNVGKILDPLADKLTQFALIICLAMKYPVLWYLMGLFVVKESFQVIAGGILLKNGKILKNALLSGKICTTVLFVSLIVMVLVPTLGQNVVNIIAAVDAVFMIISFVDYFMMYFKKSSNITSIEDTTNQ